MKRDPALAAFVLLLAVLALPATGWVRIPILPASPAGFFGIAAVLTLLFLLAVAGVPRGGRSAWRPFTYALAALPFFVFCALEAPLPGGHVRWPSLAFVAVLAIATAVAAWKPRPGAIMLAVILTWIGGGAVLARADVSLGPREWNPLLAPAAGSAGTDAGATAADRGVDWPSGYRSTTPTRLTPRFDAPLAGGPGPWWIPALRSRRPSVLPLVLLVDGAATPGPLPEADDLAFVHGSEAALDADGRVVPLGSPIDLLPFDAVVVYPRAGVEPDAARERAEARAIAGWVGGGGLLIGPPPGTPWPSPLGIRLKEAGRAEQAGVDGMRRLGLGKVVRAASEEDVLALLRADLWPREVVTAFDRTGRAPSPPSGFEPWRDHPERRRLAGLLLFGYGVALLLFAWLLRGLLGQVLSTLLCALAVAAGLAWVTPADPGFVARGVVIELGGAGGRRIEALWISAGPAGYRGDVHFHGGGFVRQLPAGVPGEVAPGTSAWFVRETIGRGREPQDHEDRHASGTRHLLRGEIDPKRLRYGRLPMFPVRIEGTGRVEALTIRYRAP